LGTYGVDELNLISNEWFVFVNAENKAEVVKITQNSQVVEETVQIGTSRIFSRLGQKITVHENDYSLVPYLPSLFHFMVTSDKKIYRPHEKTYILLNLANGANLSIYLMLSHFNQPFLQKEIILDSSGSAIYILEDLENGPYNLRVSTTDGAEESCSFSVASYTLSPLQVIIDQQNVAKDIVTIDVTVSKINLLYTGKVRIDVKCAFCNNAVVATLNEDVNGGKLTFEYGMGGHTGPFTLDFITPDGSSTTQFLEGTRTEDREEINLNNLGIHTKCAILPHEYATKVRNLYIWEAGSSTWPLILEKTVNEQVELKILEDIKALLCIQVNVSELSKPILHEFSTLKRGTSINFPNIAPFSLIRCGLITKSNHFYNLYFAVIYPEKLKVTIKSPKQAKPGSEITLELEVNEALDPNKSIHCFLMVMDTRIERNKDEIRLGKQLFNYFKQHQSNTKNIDLIHEIKRQEEIKSHQILELEQRRLDQSRENFDAKPIVNGTTTALPSDDAGQDRDIDLLKDLKKTAFSVKPSPKSYSSPALNSKIDLNDKDMESDEAEEFSSELEAPEPISVSGSTVPGPQSVQSTLTTQSTLSPTSSEKIVQDVSSELQLETILRHEEQVLYVGSFDLVLRQPVKIPLLLGDQIGKWRIEAIFCQNYEMFVMKQYMETSLDDFCEIFAPNYLECGDLCFCLINYKTTKPAILRVETYQKIQEFSVRENGFKRIELTGPTEIIAELDFEGTILDRSQKWVEKLGTEKITSSRLIYGQPGEIFEAQNVVLYPSLGHLLYSSAMALMQYPYGCAEQTSAKMAGLISTWRAVEEGVFNLKPNEIQSLKDKLLLGINRMQLFYQESKPGPGFRLWENGEPSTAVSVKVLKNLAKLRNISIPESQSLKRCLETVSMSLLNQKMMDPQLIEYHTDFGDGKIICNEDAAYYLLVTDPKYHADALAYLDRTKHESETEIYWTASKSWAGDLETTCLVLAAYANQRKISPILIKGLTYLSKYLINGCLYSTSDTVNMIEFFANLNRSLVNQLNKPDTQKTAIIDGHITTIDQNPLMGNKIELKEPGFLRLDEAGCIDYTTLSSQFKFDVNLSTPHLQVGERGTITITLIDQSTCPILHVYLPGNVAALESGANIQLMVDALKTNTYSLDVIGIRPGVCQMRVVVRDMYDQAKLGCCLPIRVIVKDK
jgi:hypothetical protein